MTYFYRMQMLSTGEFFGSTSNTFHIGELTVTDTEYTHHKIDWHYHENAYLTFLLAGMMEEGNKKETYQCQAGSLLFHHWQDTHYNVKPACFTRGLHIEFHRQWFAEHDICNIIPEGSLKLENPHLKLLLYEVFKEVYINGADNRLAIDCLLVELFGSTAKYGRIPTAGKPVWVKKIRDLIHDAPGEPWTLNKLSNNLSLHPVHPSRDFSRHFHCTLGSYIRLVRIQHALSLLADSTMPLTSVALHCGFADQSHFSRSFKSLHCITPSAFRRLLRKSQEC